MIDSSRATRLVALKRRCNSGSAGCNYAETQRGARPGSGLGRVQGAVFGSGHRARRLDAGSVCRLRQGPAHKLDAHADGDGPSRRAAAALISARRPTGSSVILMSQNSVLDARDEAAVDEWYLEHLRNMASVPGIFSAQRFKTSSAGFPRSLTRAPRPRIGGVLTLTATRGRPPHCGFWHLDSTSL